jgi:hypothetical protein
MHERQGSKRFTRIRIQFLFSALILLTSLSSASAQTGASTAGTPPNAARDGQRDFDFELGSWKIHLKRRLHPLTGSNMGGI